MENVADGLLMLIIWPVDNVHADLIDVGVNDLCAVHLVIDEGEKRTELPIFMNGIFLVEIQFLIVPGLIARASDTWVMFISASIITPLKHSHLFYVSDQKKPS